MSIHQIKTISFGVFGDDVTTDFLVDLSDYLPAEFSLIAVYTTSQVPIDYHGNYPQTNYLSYTLVGSILTVTLPIAPPTWVPPSVLPGTIGLPSVPPVGIISTPPPVSFFVTCSF